VTPVSDAPARVATLCEQCGQTDDHPKVHLGSLGGAVVSKHHDCLSAAEEQALRDSAQEEGSGPKASAIIDACKSGTKGAELVELIQSGDLPQAEGLVQKAQAEREAADHGTVVVDIGDGFSGEEADRG
jgi:hypothetical protein